MKSNRALLFIALSLIITSVHAQSAEKSYRHRATTINSTILEENRYISIYLPDNYMHSESKYPVLYLLDGGAHLQHASGAADYLSTRGHIPEIIVVAIHNIDRSRDFSPVHVDNIPTSGGAKKFLGFLSAELIPYMNETYRTAGFNILLGHSFGGTFIGYTILAKPRLFDAFLAVSPYLMFADNLVVNNTAKKLKPFKEKKYFYMTVGNEEGYFETLEEYASIMEEKAGESVEFKYLKMPEEDHSTTPYLSVFSGLKFIFAGWQLPPEMLQEDLETIDSLGEAYENNGNPEQAALNYQKAVRLGEKNGDANLNVYKTNLARVSVK